MYPAASAIWLLIDHFESDTKNRPQIHCGSPFAVLGLGAEFVEGLHAGSVQIGILAKAAVV
jgi:hypothetical protein